MSYAYLRDVVKKTEVEKVLIKLSSLENGLKDDRTPEGKRKLELLKSGISSLKNLLSYVMVIDGEITLISPIKKNNKIGWMIEIDNKTIKNF